MKNERVDQICFTPLHGVTLPISHNSVHGNSTPLSYVVFVELFNSMSFIPCRIKNTKPLICFFGNSPPYPTTTLLCQTSILLRTWFLDSLLPPFALKSWSGLKKHDLSVQFNLLPIDLCTRMGTKAAQFSPYKYLIEVMLNSNFTNTRDQKPWVGHILIQIKKHQQVCLCK